jgi:hypothetical protein
MMIFFDNAISKNIFIYLNVSKYSKFNFINANTVIFSYFKVHLHIFVFMYLRAYVCKCLYVYMPTYSKSGLQENEI